MNGNLIKSTCTFIFFIVFTSGLMAKDQHMNNAGKPDQRDIIQAAGAAAFEEQLGTETGAMGDVPVDGGISLLLAAGITYGGRRMSARRKMPKC